MRPRLRGGILESPIDSRCNRETRALPEEEKTLMAIAEVTDQNFEA